MGTKRPYDEYFEEFSFKQPKQLDWGNKLLADSFSHEDTKSADISDLADKEFETGSPLSWLASSIGSQHGGSGSLFCSSLFPEYFEFNFPKRPTVQVEDMYSSLLNSSPRIEIPVGADHQADVPVWDPEIPMKNASSSYLVDDDYGKKLKGACVIPMPGPKISAQNDNAADGRICCSCLDGGSIRCVQRHVMEAREKLRETLGHEKFVDLGFCDMGEEVAHKWTKEEEVVFHKVVYSNPVSRGKNFWEHLGMVFPSQTKKELVSYYFNVFMLRRRAAQNRSNVLEIDSDDDEWQGSDGGPFGVRGEDEDSAVESFSDQDIQAHQEDRSSVLEIDSDDDGWQGNDEGPFGVTGEDEDSAVESFGDQDIQAHQEDNSPNEYVDSDEDEEDDDVVDAAEKDKVNGHMSEAQIQNSFDEGTFDSMLHHGDATPELTKGDSDIQEDSCTSFEGQPYNMTHSCGPVDENAAKQKTVVKNDDVNSNGSSDDEFGPEYVLEHCDAKLWDATYSTGGMKGIDLLPTCSMIEEIFGPCTRNK